MIKISILPTIICSLNLLQTNISVFLASGHKYNCLVSFPFFFFPFFPFLSISAFFGISLHMLLGTAEAEVLVVATRDKQSVIFQAGGCKSGNINRSRTVILKTVKSRKKWWGY